MERVIKLIMKRDGLSYEDAKTEVSNTVDEMYEALESGDSDQAEEILMDNLGLEPDYIPQLLGIF